MTDRGVIFDLDGTLVHSSPDIAHHLNSALARISPGVEALSVGEVETLIGSGMQELVRRGLNAIGVDANAGLIEETIRHFREAYLAEPVVHTLPYEGVEAMLHRLIEKGYRIGLCTNKSEATAHLVLDHFGWSPLFNAVVGGDTTAHRKPMPDPLVEAANRLGVASEDAGMGGDSKADCGAARACGMPVILVDWGYSGVPIRGLGGDAVIASYAEFDDALMAVSSPDLE